MPQNLPPALIEPLAHEIGHSFELVELDAVVFRSTGGKLFKDFVPEGDTHVITAFRLLNALVERNQVVLFLAHVLTSKPANQTLRGLIEQACPPALTAEIDIGKQIPTVLAGLVTTRNMLRDPTVRQALAQSRDALEAVVRNIDILEVYKNLHESLHKLQITSFASLRKRVKKLADDPSLLEDLREYNEAIALSYGTARDWAEQLPEGPTSRGLEIIWIDELQAASEKYQGCLVTINAAEIMTALKEVRVVLRQVPFHLNKVVFATAQALPLQDLTDALGKISAAIGDAHPEITTAYSSMRNLHITLLGRVKEHKLWQEVDNKIWDLEETFDRPPDEAREDFIFGWPGTKSATSALADLDPMASWSESTKKNIARVDNELAREGAGKELWNHFDAYRRDARGRFFRVNAQLKKECAHLVKIGAPLRAIMEDLDHG
jgi:hypothetical protein